MSNDCGNGNHLPDDLIPATEAARLVKTHPSTVYRWILSGKMPGYKRGSRYLVSRRDVEDMVRPVRVGATAEVRSRRAESAGHRRATEELRRRGIIK